MRKLLPGPRGGPKRKPAPPTSAAKLKQDAATTLFVLDRRGPGEGKANTIYVRDKRHQDGKPGS